MSKSLFSTWPSYCCAILRDRAGRYLLEQRPMTDCDAAGCLTCFGGGRHDGEHPDECLSRELFEELGWVPSLATAHLELWVADRCTAWFYLAHAPEAEEPLLLEAGTSAVRLHEHELDDAPLARWHACVLSAFRSDPDRLQTVHVRA